LNAKNTCDRNETKKKKEKHWNPLTKTIPNNFKKNGRAIANRNSGEEIEKIVSYQGA